MKQLTGSLSSIERRRAFLVEGKILHIIWFLSWPVLLQMFMHLLVETADMKMVGTLGAEAVAAVGMAMHLVMVMAICAMGVSTGITASVSRCYGSEDYRGTVQSAAQAVLLALFFSGAIAAVAYGASGMLLDWMGADEAVKPLALGYIRVFSAGIIFFIGRFTLWAVYQGLGDNRTPLKLDILTNVINISGNYVFIFGVGFVPAFGVTGAAMGTVLAHAIGISLAFHLLVRKAFPFSPAWREFVRFNRSIMRSILKIGAPAALQMVIQTAANAIILSMVSRTAGAVFAVSAYSIGLLIFQYALFPGSAVGHAASTLVGINLGALNPARAHRSGWSCAGVGALLIGFLSLAIFIFAPQLIGFFVDDPRVIAAGVPMVRTLAVVEPLHAVGIILARAFYVAGEPRIPFTISLICWLLIRVPLAWVLGFSVGLQGPGIWYAIAASQVLAATAMIFFYQRKKGFPNSMKTGTALAAKGTTPAK